MQPTLPSPYPPDVDAVRQEEVAEPARGLDIARSTNTDELSTEGDWILNVLRDVACDREVKGTGRERHVARVADYQSRILHVKAVTSSVPVVVRKALK